MKEKMEQFNTSPSPESPEQNKSEVQKSPEESNPFAEAVEQIKTNKRGIKILTVMEKGYLPNQEELRSIDVQGTLTELRKKYPTIEDVQKDLGQIIDEQIGVVYQEGRTKEQHEQAVQEKQLQYKREAAQGVVDVLAPVYEEFGAVSSDENKTRIIENLTDITNKIDHRSISSSQRDYVKKNVFAAANQELTSDEARRVIQMQQEFLDTWRQVFPDSQLGSEFASAINQIKEKSGLALDEIRGQGGPEKEIQPERFELKGEKKEVEDTEIPIDVHLSEKHLKIINVQEYKSWKADYLLVDPATFDQKNPTTGYKSIRENDSFILGRQDPLGFKLPKTVSGDHLKIELKDGNLSIEDLNSTNGTILQSEESKQSREEQIETIEDSPEKKQAIEDFYEYVENHQQEIEDELYKGKGLVGLFYRDFYNRNIDNLKYQENNSEVEKLEKEYFKSVKLAKDNLEKKEKEGENLMPKAPGHWFSCSTNKGIYEQAGIGRFYLNLNPEYVGQVFEQAVEEFKNEGLNSQMKIPLRGSAKEFNRLDKMVIYFNSEEEEQALQIIENLYNNNTKAFDDSGTPQFTAEVKSKKGENMVGVGFGEEPSLHYNSFGSESFGNIRAKILQEVYITATNFRLSVLDENFDFETYFCKACKENGVDPQNPAFNLTKNHEGHEPFAELKNRMQQAKAES